ncbi:hypothetical protein O4H49_15030 [Kiloniella laminariae]|uniref:Holin n=1 Tax=Kiloniella laminariae TaxID=454162 RepID=A0ABT4LLW0_9PROT|nr:hypothetical protein [Kiloniella laminariae]MCZ4282101.1 hypothetical protein [Kiloniella laminariae]
MSKKTSYLPVILKSSGWVLSRIGTLLATIFAASAFASLVPSLGNNTQLLLEPLLTSAVIAAVVAIGGIVLAKWADRKYGDQFQDHTVSP